jgi:hypothetical protein
MSKEHCAHKRYSYDTETGIGNCVSCGAEGRMVFVVPEPDSGPVAIGYLRQLVEALEGAFISTWQSTAAWQKQLDQARAFLDRAA